MAEILQENNGFLGKISIADDVIATIAGTAAMEIDGVAFMSTRKISDIAEGLGKRNFGKGVKIELKENTASVELHIVVKRDYKIPELSEKVQERVKAALETMTGLEVLEVNVNVAGLAAEKSPSKRREKGSD
ncbi:MAG: Asp23/Gls24 family envelope stress response protein [Defluviitaleaceae bacterium]|nr:Asp23/Gls24 family envelope stress response protein [Defluviitaleaceae bacterium]